MVVVNGIKYACERCIRGHRVTTCNHTDQPLMMIKPKGRPSTTCAHCKELRKNKNSNPAGSCTCGRQEKKRLAQKAKEEARAKAKVGDDDCKCVDGEKCTCHSLRKAFRRTPSSRIKGTASSSVTSADSPIISTLDGCKVVKNHGLSSLPSFHSSQSLDRDFSLAQSPPFSPASFHAGYSHNNSNWDTSSAASSLVSESKLNIMDRGHANGLPSQTDAHSSGSKYMKSSNKARPAEVSVSLDELAELDNLSGSFDNIGFQNRMAWPQTEPKHEYLDLFADTSENTNKNYRALKQNHLQHPRGSDRDIYSKNPVESVNLEGKTSRSNSYNKSGPGSLLPESLVESTTSNSSKYPMHAQVGKDYSAPAYQMSQSYSIPQPHVTARQLQPQGSFGREGLPSEMFNMEDESSHSVEVLSLTPSFMDIPDNSNLYSASSNPFLNSRKEEEPRKRSVSIHKNHRYDSFSRDNPRVRHASALPQSTLTTAGYGLNNLKDGPAKESYDNIGGKQVKSMDYNVELPSDETAPVNYTRVANQLTNEIMATSMEPTSSGTPEIDLMLGRNPYEGDLHLASKPSINFGISAQLDELSFANTMQASPTSFSDNGNDFNLNDIDKLMSEP
ncbi:LADA_0F06524g1_1 [Lachancea dasiensis]|uniref:LADA_0F06524g1_1 n=1 Tax=Lachancea dasiensis TaxID=1072105 RepID=A0A1G4JJU4_9SACH|nr:LADA_0F06524g1_1 [Lachancea dasiensis]